MQVISLTSIPPRFSRLGPVLASLVSQVPRAESVLLCLPRAYRRFPGPVTPPTLPAGVELIWSETDLGPATKVLPAARHLAQRAVDLIYCDDDCLYAPGWAAALVAARRGREVAAASGFDVTCLRRRSAPLGDTDIAQGFSGVLVTPDMIPQEAHDIPPEAWSVDDLWLSAQYARQGLPVRLAPDARALCMPLDLPAPLQDAAVEGRTRASANAACAALVHERYGLWPLPG